MASNMWRGGEVMDSRLSLRGLATGLVGAVLLFGGSMSRCLGDMLINGYDANRHDRFVTDRGGEDFIGSTAATGFTQDLDFSGVGRVAGGQWVTMISPTLFVSARHSAPSGMVTFHLDDNPLGATIQCSIVGGTPVGATDIWVGSVQVDSQCDTSLIANYPIAATGGSYLGQTVYQMGVSPSAYPDPTTKVRIGRNVLTQIEANSTIIDRTGDWGVYADDSAAGDLLAPFETTPANFDPDETRFVGGDSGGPSFLAANDGSMQLIGIHSWVDDGAGPLDTIIPNRRSSGDAFLPTHRVAILAAIPEPSPLLYVGAVTALALLISELRRKQHVG